MGLLFSYFSVTLFKCDASYSSQLLFSYFSVTLFKCDASYSSQLLFSYFSVTLFKCDASYYDQREQSTLGFKPLANAIPVTFQLLHSYFRKFSKFFKNRFHQKKKKKSYHEFWYMFQKKILNFFFQKNSYDQS